MSTTNYPGIDYAGPGGTVNRDPETGIRFGIIRGNNLMAEALDDITVHGEDLGFRAAEEELKTKLRHALSDYYSDTKRKDEGSALDMAVESAFESLDGGWSDRMDFNGPWQWEHEGTAVRLAEGGDVWVFKSPFYTYAQYTSPCAPGACYLTSPLEPVPDGHPKCYCLDGSWFDEGVAPYPVYEVATDKLVASGEQKAQD